MTDKIIVITGPTAIGKTDISLEIAKIYDGEIINADASQFKKELNIGTAKIDLSKTDIKHHLIDVIGPMDNYNVSSYQKEGRKLIEEIKGRGHTPIVVGGSGLYINSLLYDYHFDSEKRDNDSPLNDLSNEELMERLEEIDPDSAKNIPLGNRKRLLRAVEVASSGMKISENNDGDKLLYDAVIICLTTDREVLYDRINKRVDLMLENGLIEECKNLINQGYDLDKIGDIGYLEVGKYLNNIYDYDRMAEEIKKRTRHFAKRQMTWFRNKLNPIFIEMNYDDKNIVIENIKKAIEGKNR
jgi:tRNA dimethylallyltransferase